MKAILLGGIGIVLPFMAGCRSDSDYVRRDEFRKGIDQAVDWKIGASLEDAIRTQKQAKDELDELMKRALTASSIKERSLAILASTDHAVGSLTQTLQAISAAVDVIVDNLANVKTTAFKRQTARLEGGRLVGIVRDFSQGSLTVTNRKLDISIQGDGFFQVIVDQQGTKGYTRAGSFTRDANGLLLDPNGHPLEPAVTIDTTVAIDTISITADGRVKYMPNGQTTFTDAGQILLAHFANPDGLMALSHNVFAETQESGTPLIDNPGNQGLGMLAAGTLEESNVDIVQEQVSMLVLTHWYKGITEAIETLGQR